MIKKSYRKLSALLLLSISFASLNCNINNSLLDNKIPEDKALIKEALIKRVLNQVSNIDKILEEIAQAVNNKVIKVRNKSEALKFIKDLRNCISDIKKQVVEKPNTQCLNSIIDLNRDIIADLYEAFSNNLTNLKEIRYKFNIIQTKSSENLNLIEIKYDFNQNLLEKLKSIKFEQIAQDNNRLDSFINKTSKFINDWKIKKIFYRSLPYAALTAYVTVNQDDEVLPESLLKLKRLVISPFKKHTGKKSEKAAGPLDKYSNTAIGEKLDNLKNMGILGIDLKPYLNLSLVGLFMKHVVEDFKSVKNASEKSFNKLVNKLRNKPEEKLATFDKVIGFNKAKQELGNLVYYFSNMNLIKRTGVLSSINNSYIIEGDLNLAETLAKATVGEINKNNKCELIEIHATELIGKKLSDIVKDSYKKEPLIILIKELELIDNLIDRNTLNNIIKDIDKLNKNNKVSIIATTSNKNLIASALTRSNRLSKTIKLQAPNTEERYQFIEQELSNYCIDINNFDIYRAVEITNGYSYNEISQWLKHAQFKAHQDNSVLTQEHLSNF